MAVAVLVLSLTCAAQTVGVPTVTRTVLMFGELERKLEAGDAAAKRQLLADDFEERLCAEPGTPVPRETWLRKAASSSAKLSQEAVHLYGDIAVYSALRSPDQGSESILDIWKKDDSGWKLSVRYSCPATGAKPGESALPKRY
jgi:hypothetical protein